MTDFPKCPKCGSEYTYFDGSVYVCPDCSHEFNLTDETEAAADVATTVFLQPGASVVIMALPILIASSTVLGVPSR